MTSVGNSSPSKQQKGRNKESGSNILKGIKKEEILNENTKSKEDLENETDDTFEVQLDDDYEDDDFEKVYFDK